jgi:hypothetical protein
MTDNVKLDFLLAMTADHQKTIEALEQEMRARASPLRFMPPEDRPDGYVCLGLVPVTWHGEVMEWRDGVMEQVEPLGFAPAPEDAP